MGILTRFTLRTLARNRARTLATIIGIALSCTLVTAIFTTVTSIGGGLLQHQLEADGSWQVTSPRVSEAKLAQLANNSHVTDLAVGRELGSAQLSGDLANTLGTFLTVKSLPVTARGDAQAVGTRYTGNVGLAQAPAISVGRLPETADEIALPQGMRTLTPSGTGISADAPIDLGSTVTLELGDRIFTDDETGATSILSVMDSHATAENGWDTGTEALENLRARTYTVVGFFAPDNYSAYFGNYEASAAGTVALTGPSPAGTAEGFAAPYLSTDFTSYDDLEGWANTLLAGSVTSRKGGSAAGTSQVDPDSAGYLLHNDLLRYQGMTDDRAIWSTLWALAAILTAVVMVASASLIYTSFAISVTERMRQFGLLSGIGASRRQLRRTVLAEALVLGCVGIPLGLALGIAGTAATLSLTQGGFAAILGTEIGITLVVQPQVIALAALIALVTLLVSAWIPAARAGRVSTVDAIRQTRTVRERGLARLLRRWRGRGGPGSRLSLALFGVSGLVAHRNLTRSSSRGRVVVVSLAVSVALVIVCGAVDAYLQPIAGLTGSDAARELDADIAVSANAKDSDDAATFAERFQRFASEASAVEGATQRGTFLSGYTGIVIPARALDAGAIDEMKNVSGFSDDWAGGGGASASSQSPYAENGDYTGSATVYYIDDASWAAYVGELGLDASQLSDPAHPRAIALNVYRSDNGQRYLDLAPFSEATTLDAYRTVDAGLPVRDGYVPLGIFEDASGQPVVRYFKLADDRSANLAQDENGSFVYEDVPVAEAGLTPQPIEVAALADRVPDVLASAGAVGSFPSLVMPMSALAKTSRASGGTVNVAHGQLYLGATDPDATERDVNALASLTLPSGDGAMRTYVYNIAADRQANVDGGNLVKLFTLLFSVITMLIALANVFNTLTNSIVLRTREFAVLRSAGMGERAFVRMIAYECVSYAWRGLLGGLVLGLGVSWAMWQSMQYSFAGLGMAIPWPYIGAAAAGALLVLGLSVLYALRRTHRQNLVEALRMES